MILYDFVNFPDFGDIKETLERRLFFYALFPMFFLHSFVG